MDYIGPHLIVLCLVMIKVMELTAEAVTSLGIDYIRRRRAALPLEPPATHSEKPETPSLPQTGLPPGLPRV